MLMNPLDKLLSINQHDRDTAESEFEARRRETQVRFKEQIERYNKVVRSEMAQGYNPDFEIYELDGERYAGISLPHSPRHAFLILLTDEGYRMIENGEQCYMDAVKEGEDTINVLHTPRVDNREVVDLEGDTAGNPSRGYRRDDGTFYESQPILEDQYKWHDSAILTSNIDVKTERQVSLMADHLHRTSDVIENKQMLRVAGY
jgi:hypothetical protein